MDLQNNIIQYTLTNIMSIDKCSTIRTANHTAYLRGGRLAVRHRGGATGGSGVDGVTGGAPVPAGTSNATGSKDRGLAHGAAVHSELNRAGGPGVA